MSEVITLAQQSISKGSKSFALASKFFSRNQWEGACLIYYWCRFCDDQIDNQGNANKLNDLFIQTHSIWAKNTKLEPPFLALKEAVKRFQIPPEYPNDLLEGMAMDVQGYTYQTVNDLHLYCYRVASTVGLMMSHVMGIYKIEALKEAAHLGMAMQLTNIARDVKEDFLNNRCYLPEDWLKAEGLEKEMLFEAPEHLWRVVQRLLKEADEFYASGLSGVKYLPLRSALTILIAGKFYREIGKEMERRGVSALEKRTIVPLERKIWLICEALIEITKSLPQRMIGQQKKVMIDRIWRLS